MQSGKRTSVSWGRAEQTPALHLGVFGKHPGWDDHIDDLGLDTERLVRVRQRVYTEGVAGNIDSGAWEKLDDSQRLGGFGHELVWRFPDGLVVGRLWSSRDGKGRTKYPMAVVAYVSNVAASWVESVVMPRLEQVERACVASESADEVRRIIDQARLDLRTALPVKAQDLGGVAGPSELAALAAAPELGPDMVGLRRALYEIEREMTAFRPAKNDRRSASRAISIGAQHLRVPACAPTTMGAASLWTGVLRSQIDPGADIVVLRPHAKAWIDVIVGEPTAAQLFCTKVSETGLALVTSVPYTLDAEFSARCDALVNAWKAGKFTADEAPASPATGTLAPGPAAAPPRKRPPWMLWGGAGALLLMVGGALVMKSLSGPTPPAQPNLIAKNDVKATPKEVPSTKTDVVPELQARQEEAKKRLEPGAEETARLERERKAKDEQDRLAREKEAADRRAAEERDRAAKEEAERVRLAREAADRKAAEDRDRLAKEEADRTEKARLAREEADRNAAAERDRLAKVDADRRAAEEKDRLARADAAAAAEKRRAVIARAGEISALIGAGYTLADSSDAGSVAAQARAFAAEPALDSARDAPEVRALLERVKTLESIDASADAAALLKQAGAASSGALAESLSAWSRLASGAVKSWPASGSDVAAAGQAVESIRAALATSPDRAFAARAGSRLGDQARAVWGAYFSRVDAADAAGIEAACAVRAAFGIEDGALAPRERFNVLVWELKRAASTSAEAGVALRGADDFITKATALEPAVSGRADVKAALATLTPPAPEAQAGAVDPRSLGPGARGWKGELREADGQNILTFTPPQGAASAGPLQFVRVQTPAGPAYLCTTEVSVGLFIEAVNAAGRWADVLPTMNGFRKDSAPEDARSVRTWSFDGGGSPSARAIRPGESGDELGRGWIPVGGRTRGAPYYPDASKVDPPSPGSPVQHIAPLGAALVANLLGCRLPTSAEWAAAHELSLGASANRRDASWKRLVEYLASMPAVQNAVIWPDAGQCVPESMQGPNGQPSYPVGKRAEAAVSDDDGLIWFAPVESGTGLFKHLIGNVAEYVFDDAAAVEAVPEPTMARLKGSIGNGEAVRMIGASALSSAQIAPTQAHAVKVNLTAQKSGFSDVGFRLAFSASGAGIAAGLSEAQRAAHIRRAASELKYLSP